MSLALVVLTFTPVAVAQRIRLHVTSVTVQASTHDTPPKGKPNRGDRIAFREMLLNREPLFGRKKGKGAARAPNDFDLSVPQKVDLNATAIA